MTAARGASGLAAALALTIPIVAHAADAAISRVPVEVREGGLALGLTPSALLSGVILPSARAGLISACLLGLSRVAGESAPVLLTAASNDDLNRNPLHGPQASLGAFIYQQAASTTPGAQELAWAAAAVLLLLAAALNALAVLAIRRSR